MAERYNFKHGMTDTRTYKSWDSMKQRCLNKNTEHYKNYGGRGITICEEWLSFENFFRDMGERPEGKTLDKIDNNLGYCKTNCKWSSLKEQQNNTRYNRLITYKGKTQTVSQWARELNIDRKSIYYRLNSNWNVKKVLT